MTARSPRSAPPQPLPGLLPQLLPLLLALLLPAAPVLAQDAPRPAAAKRSGGLGGMFGGLMGGSAPAPAAQGTAGQVLQLMQVAQAVQGATGAATPGDAAQAQAIERATSVQAAKPSSYRSGSRLIPLNRRSVGAVSCGSASFPGWTPESQGSFSAPSGFFLTNPERHSALAMSWSTA